MTDKHSNISYDSFVSYKNKTPCYVYNICKINEKIDDIMSSFSGNTNFELFYAIKANNNSVISKHFVNRGVGLSVSSAGELKAALSCGSEKISYTAPYLDEKALLLIDKYPEKVEVNVNNYSEIKKVKPKISLGIRINPLFGESPYRDHSAGEINSQFGVPFNELKKLPCNVVRLHLHFNSDTNSVDTYLKGLELALDIAIVNTNIQTINLGGGLSVDFNNDFLPVDINKLSKGINKILSKFSYKSGRKIKLQMEPGSYLVRESGYYIATLKAKENKFGQSYYFTNGTRHDIKGLITISQNIVRPSGAKEALGGIYGATCQREDVFVEQTLVPNYNVGDLLVIKNTGAYCSVQSDNFHIFKRPKEYFL